MSYFEIRRKQKIEEQLSDAIAEEEAISDITTESQQLSQVDYLNLKLNQMKMMLK